MRGLTLGIGALAIAGATVALILVPDAGGGPAVSAVVAFLAIAGVVTTLWKVLGTAGRGMATVAAPPWTDSGALFERAPERTETEESLSGASFAALLEEAGQTARSDGTVDAGIEVVRPVLRRALVDALVMDRGDLVAVEQSLANGDWTEDRTAAAVLDEAVEYPDWSIGQRIQAWLFPERVVRTQIRHSVQAIAVAANDAAPGVPGQNAPRSVPVLRPSLEDLQRGIDGRVQEAVDPLAAARGPRPPGHDEPAIDVDADDGPGSNVSQSGTASDREAESGETSSDESSGGQSGERSTAGETTTREADEDRELFGGRTTGEGSTR